jgi:hypothetical protein
VTFGSGNLGQRCPGHHKVIVREPRHDVHMQMEERVIRSGVAPAPSPSASIGADSLRVDTRSGAVTGNVRLMLRPVGCWEAVPA